MLKLQHQIVKQQQETAQKQQTKTKENFAKFKWLALNTLKKFGAQIGTRMESIGLKH